MVSTDRIQKRVVLKAPLERVWRAVTEAKRFGSWFGVAFEGEFAAGKVMVATLVGTSVDPAGAKAMERLAGLKFSFTIERLEPMRLFSYRWHPFAIDQTVDYSDEQPTLVTFEFADVAGGTQLTITETGFDGLPVARRADAFEANDEGWDSQLDYVTKYLALPE